jgi:hypothetical protein
MIQSRSDERKRRRAPPAFVFPQWRSRGAGEARAMRTTILDGELARGVQLAQLAACTTSVVLPIDQGEANRTARRRDGDGLGASSSESRRPRHRQIRLSGCMRSRCAIARPAPAMADDAPNHLPSPSAARAISQL